MNTIISADLPTFLATFPNFGTVTGVQVALDLVVSGDDDVTIPSDATVSTTVHGTAYTFTNTATLDTDVIGQSQTFWGVPGGGNSAVASGAHLLFRRDGYVAVPRDSMWFDLPLGVGSAANANPGTSLYSSVDPTEDIQGYIDIATDIHRHTPYPLAQLYLAAHLYALSLRDAERVDNATTIKEETIGPFELEYQTVPDTTKTARNSNLQRTKYGRIYMTLVARFPSGRAVPLVTI